MKQLRKLQILRPQDFIEELALEADHDRGASLARAAVWLKTMTADQRQEELAFPGIGQGKLELHGRLRCGGKLGVEAFERTARRLHLALRPGGFEQGLDLVDFGDEFVAGHGGMWSKGLIRRFSRWRTFSALAFGPRALEVGHHCRDVDVKGSACGVRKHR